MDARKSQRRRVGGAANPLGFAIGSDFPPAQLKLLVKQQVASRGTLLHGERRERTICGVKLRHAPEVDGADDIDVMQDERLFRRSRIPQEKISRLFEAPARIEQDFREMSTRMPKLSFAFR